MGYSVHLCFCQHLAQWKDSSSQKQKCVAVIAVTVKAVFLLVCLMRNTELGKEEKSQFYHYF